MTFSFLFIVGQNGECLLLFWNIQSHLEIFRSGHGIDKLS